MKLCPMKFSRQLDSKFTKKTKEQSTYECDNEDCAWWSYRENGNGQPDNGCALEILAEK